MRFPVLTFKGNLMYFYVDEDKIFVCSQLALKKGYYRGLEMIDSDGFLYRVEDAEVLRGEGPFWGYNLFFNRTLRVRPVFSGEPERVDFSEIKCRVLLSLEKRDAWKSRGDFEELRARVEAAETMEEMMRYFKSGGASAQ